MGAPSQLPPRLKYLRSVRKHLSTLRAEQIDENVDQSPLEAALRVRLRGLSVDNARAALNEDRVALQTWLSEPGRENDRLNFVLGYLLIAEEAPEQLLEPPTPPSLPERQVFMDLPEEARMVNTEEGTLGFRYGKLRLYVCAVKDEEMDLELSQFRAQGDRYGTADEVSLTEVQFGQVKGMKCVKLGTMPTVWKRVEYLLKVPGGHVSAILQAQGRPAETPLESLFQTLRVVRNNGGT